MAGILSVSLHVNTKSLISHFQCRHCHCIFVSIITTLIIVVFDLVTFMFYFYKMSFIVIKVRITIMAHGYC